MVLKEASKNMVNKQASLSVITPVYNEEGNIKPLVSELQTALDKTGREYEIIIVDDGSSDKSFEELKAEAKNFAKCKVIRFRRNFGQTAAIAAGIASARGEIIATIDSDLENDPADFPKLLAPLDQGYDLVSGWRQNRWADQTVTRRLPSKMANWLISKVGGVYLHDYGCTFKVYRREVIAGMPLYGDMHRFIPVYVALRGARIAEVPVNHRPRRHGVSKYGMMRIFRVLLDLFFLKFFTTYINRPIHFFGGLGLASLFVGSIAGVWSVILKIFYDLSFVRTPLPIFSALFIIVGVQLLVMGVLAEVMIRTYYESQGKTPYQIKETLNFS